MLVSGTGWLLSAEIAGDSGVVADLAVKQQDTPLWSSSPGTGPDLSHISVVGQPKPAAAAALGFATGSANDHLVGPRA